MEILSLHQGNRWRLKWAMIEYFYQIAKEKARKMVFWRNKLFFEEECFLYHYLSV